MEEKPLDDINEITPEILSVHSLNAGTLYNAPARSNMMAGHFAQRLVIKGSEPNLVQTGVEEEFGKYTLSTQMPGNGTILAMLDLYPASVVGGEDSINFNPETLVLYRNNDTGEFDCFSMPYHCSLHPQFGFKYVDKPAKKAMGVGRTFEKGTIFQDTPAVHGESHYTFGKNVNVAYMSHPNVGLDGYVISEDLLDDFEFSMYESRSIEFGANDIPLNLYGNDQIHKAFPDVGDYIREDGLLMATRRYDSTLAPSLLSIKDLQTVDYHFDNKVYVRAGKGRVVHLTVIKSDNVNRQLPEEMTRQAEKYANALRRFHRSIIRFEEQMIQENRKMGGDGRIKVSRRLQRLLVKSKAIVNYPMETRQYVPVNQDFSNRQGLTLVYRKEPLNTWRINFTIEYKVKINRGYKLTCLNGGILVS